MSCHAPSFECLLFKQGICPIPSEAKQRNNIRFTATTGDAEEIKICTQLDGDLDGLGSKFWQFLVDKNQAVKQRLNRDGPAITAISYTDRYLLSPLSLALLFQIITGLKKQVNESRWLSPKMVVRTIATRSVNIHQGRGAVIWTDWDDTKIRDTVLKEVLGAEGMAVAVNVTDRRNAEHARTLAINFSSGEGLILCFDEGVSYWQADQRLPFSFHRIPKDQANAIRHMKVRVRGKPYSTRLFLKPGR